MSGRIATVRRDLDLAGLFDPMNRRGLPAVMLVPTLLMLMLMLMPFGFFPARRLIGLAMAFVAAQIALGRRRVRRRGWMGRRRVPWAGGRSGSEGWRAGPDRAGGQPPDPRDIFGQKKQAGK